MLNNHRCDIVAHAEKLKEVEMPGKLANDLNGYKKKNKLGLSPEAVAEWLK